LKKKSNIQIDNSFTLKFRNTTNSVKRVTLFKEGLDSNHNVTIVQKSESSVANGFQNPILLSPIVWSFATSQPFYYLGGFNITAPYSDSNWQVQTTTTFDINTTGTSITGIAVTLGQSLAEFNDAINNAIVNNATLTDLKSPSGQVPIVNIFFDSVGFLRDFGSSLPQPLISIYNYWGVSIQYPTDLTNRITEITDVLSVLPQFSHINNTPTTLVQSANGVIIAQGNNISYNEILESQNGSALQIESLSVNIGLTPTILEKQSQLLQPYTFTKRDVNGNEIEIFKNQLIDPYQDQYSYDKVDLVQEENGEEYILDGNTGFTYKIEPLTNVFITYNYKKVSNSTFQKREGAEELKKNKKNIEILSKETDYANVYELDNIPISKKKKVYKTNWNKILLFIGGVYALYLLTKTNQK